VILVALVSKWLIQLRHAYAIFHQRPIASAATPQTTPVVSSSPTQQTVSTKPTTAAAPNPKQQQVTTTNNNTNAISRPTGGASGTTISPVSHPTSKSQAGITPQIKTVNQQHLSSIRRINTTTPLPITLINSTAGINSTARQNYTFAATSPAATTDKLLYLGYHGTANPTHDNSGSKHDDSMY
jgi:hypothetical protein